MADAELVRALEKATSLIPVAAGFTQARFALYPTARSDTAALIGALNIALAPLSPDVRPFSAIEQGVLILTLPGRTFSGQSGLAFDAAYLIAERFGLDATEPEIHTALYPGDVGEQDDYLEGMDFTRFCFAKTDARLEQQKTWALTATNVFKAWEFSASLGRPAKGAGIVIAQPDTGVTTHPELAEVHSVAGIDLIDNKPGGYDPLDYEGNPSHGTGTASVVVSPEQGEVTGSAPAASHMPIRAIESVIRLSQFRIAEAIDYATEHGAHVITMSLGGIPSLVLWRALQRAILKDVIVLAAAGNCAKVVVWPARYEDCIAVAGVNYDGQPWKGTCSGPDVDVSAPAENVYRARSEPFNDGFSYVVEQGQGTSFAVALTAGIAANWLAHHGRDTVIAQAKARGESVQALFRRLLRATAHCPDRWDDRNMGAGIVDALALLKAPFDSAVDEAYAESGVVLPSSSIRTLAQEVGGIAAPGDINLERYGMEIALAVLEGQRRQPVETSVDAVTPEHAAHQDQPRLTSIHLRRAAILSSDLSDLLER
ncbi:S8 family peptidase [Pseudomonas azotoformans]